jgi:hypothetical protein
VIALAQQQSMRTKVSLSLNPPLTETVVAESVLKEISTIGEHDD